MADKVSVQNIAIMRAEGPLDHTRYPVGKTFKFAGWADANAMLRGIAREKTRTGDTGGYDKCDFTITFADGETYSGRADVMADGDDTDLGKHMRQFLGYLAGAVKPAHMKPEHWQQACSQNEADGSAERARHYLATYDIP
jgi:hypothetical protein